MLRASVLALCLSTTACFFESDRSDNDIVGPYTGTRTRFVVDSLLLPMNNNEARLYGSDLDGNEYVDNQVGMVISTLILSDAADQHISDRIMGGDLDMVIEIQADDLQNDERVGIWVYGYGDTDVRPVGGALVDGAFIPNWVRDTAPENTGSATLPLPIIADADTSRMDVPYMQISLVPDGNGGYDAQIHGGIRNAFAAARSAILQQLREQPEHHRWMWTLVDRNNDGVVEPYEFDDNSLFQSLLHPDIELGGEDLLSIGIGFHLIPCPSGNCALSSSVDHCFDRVHDGDEVDVDCGGSCGRCPVGLACSSGDDCQSGTCDDDVCTAPTCFDGLKNGFEASTDCGGACQRKCEIGQVCGMDRDCQYGCTANIGGGGTGVCKAP
jgi:hypothetical protein